MKGGVRRPNVIWVVWDTVRSDHMSLYGYSKATTPRLDEFARQALVFDNCLSPAPHTIPAHASMFTGLLPSEHGASNAYQRLDDEFITVAELLSKAGYRTYFWSANPHVSGTKSFDQGFQKEEHPWDRGTRADALRIIKKKIAADSPESEMVQRLNEPGPKTPWTLKACGELAQAGVLRWLNSEAETNGGANGANARLKPDAPFFIFLNYMEAHRPLVPRDESRRRFLTEVQVERSRRLNFDWVTTWAYTFGLHSLPAEELEIYRGLYDASILELDAVFAELLDALGAGGHLDDTVIALTSDHGESMGDHHMLDHQYSLYGELLRIPLLIHYPSKVKAGRDSRPVMSYDLFPTILELAGLNPPVGVQYKCVSLLSPLATRDRVCEYPAPFEQPYAAVGDEFSSFDPAVWHRRLWSLQTDRYKLIRSASLDKRVPETRHELYDLEADPGEMNNLAVTDVKTVVELSARLDAYLASIKPHTPRAAAGEETAEETEMLKTLGYVDPGADKDQGPTSRPKNRAPGKRRPRDVDTP